MRLAERQDAALQEEKWRQAGKEFSQLLRNWTAAEREWKEKQEAYRKSLEIRNDVRETYQEMERLFLDAQAGILAENLTEGTPCPVCGSVHHPALAKKAEHAPDKETLDQKKEELQKQNEVTAALSEAAGNFGRQTEAAREELARRIAWRAAAHQRIRNAKKNRNVWHSYQKSSLHRLPRKQKNSLHQKKSVRKRAGKNMRHMKNSSSRNRSSGKNGNR